MPPDVEEFRARFLRVFGELNDLNEESMIAGLKIEWDIKQTGSGANRYENLRIYERRDPPRKGAH